MGLFGAALAGGLLGVGSNLLGNQSIAEQNARSQQFSREMYSKQFEDNIKLWNMQNAYNHPMAQMDRFRKAGLNPNLIYGSGSSGAAGSAGSIATPDIQPAEFRSAQYTEAANAINQYFDLQIKQAQVNNLRQQNTNMFNDMLLKLDQWFGDISTDPKQFKRLLQGNQLHRYGRKMQQFNETRLTSYQADRTRISRNFDTTRLEEMIRGMKGLADIRQMEAEMFKALGAANKFLAPLFRYLAK